MAGNYKWARRHRQTQIASIAGKTRRNLCLISVCATLMLASCASAPGVSDDGATVRTEVGYPGCKSCTLIRTFTSKTLVSQLYAVKDANNEITGQHVSASMRLGASNRKAWLTNGLSDGSANIINSHSSIVGAEARLFEGQTLADADHPYRFILRLHLNSNLPVANVQLAENDTFQVLPAIRLEGDESRQNCFSGGCVWDADYVLPTKMVNDHIADGRPLTVFIGNHLRKQVASKDGFNLSYEVVHSGLYLQVSTLQLKNFTSIVRSNLIN